MPICKLGQRRQVVIPQEICDALGLREGDFVEVTREESVVVIKPKKLVDADDVLTPEEEKIVHRGEAQLKHGKQIAWDDLKKKLDLQPYANILDDSVVPRGRQTAQCSSA